LIEVNNKFVVYDKNGNVIIITRSKNIAIKYARNNGTHGN